MANDLQKLMGNVRVINGRLTAPDENEPVQYSNRGYPYDNPVSTRFYQEYAKYASDYFVGVKAQGLNPSDPYKWETVTMRMADVVRTSAAMQRQFDNHKMILLDAMKYAYIPRGAKFIVMGSTWLCTNPENISGSDGMAMVQRCNATWRHLDFFGNILAEPIVVETDILRANAPDPQYNMNVAKGYFNVKAQYNVWTAQIDDNTRMLLGTGCYIVTGFSDFFQEFTGNDCSVRMVEFTIRRDEINKTIDDTENRVAGGKTFSWEILLTGKPSIFVGDTFTCAATSERCGEILTSSNNTVFFNYLWSSDDESVATVDENGVVTAVGEGDCNIVCTLNQNDEIWSVWPLSVKSAVQGDAVDFLVTPPTSVSAYSSATLIAVCMTDGVEVPGTVDWSFSGADVNAYSVQINGNEVSISCWNGSVAPLMVTASWHGESVSVLIDLIGV